MTSYNKALFCRQRPVVNRINSLQQDEKTAQVILNAFNTWQFKREQPNSEKLFSAILSAVENKSPVSFVMYWGKGDRTMPNERESQALLHLESMLNRIRQAYLPGSKVTLILTDTHTSLNGHSDDESKNYFLFIQKMAQEKSMNSVFFSEIIKLDEEKLLEMESDFKIPADVMTSLQTSASKHSKKYSAQKAAKLYYLQNQLEKEAISKAFSGHIFLTYNGNNMNSLFPDDLPIFHMYSMSKGNSEKPWHK